MPTRVVLALRWGVLVSLLALLFGRDVFRPLEQPPSVSVDVALKCVRGLLLIFGHYLVYPLTLAGILLMAGRHLGVSLGAWLLVAWKYWIYLAYLVLAVLFSESPDAAASRVDSFQAYVLPLLTACVGVSWLLGWEDFHRGVMVFALINIVALGISGRIVRDSTLSISSLEEERLVVESDTISTAVNFYIFGIGGLVAAFSPNAARAFRLVGLTTMLLCTGIALCTGSRGPLFAFVGCVVLFGVCRRGSFGLKLPPVAAALITLLVSWRFLSGIVPQARERLDMVVGMVWSGQNGPSRSVSVASIDERLDFYEAVFDSEPKLFGRGIGGFSDLSHRSNEYVHNLFLEAYFETGIVGLLLLVWILTTALSSLLNAYFALGHEGAFFCFLLLCYYLIEAQFSTTLLANRGLLPFLLVSFLLPHEAKASRTTGEMLFAPGGE